MIILGIDIGGTGVKGALVDIETGKLARKKIRLETPKNATAKDICGIVKEIKEHFRWNGLIGCTFPAVVQKGEIHTAANIDDGWVGVNAQKLLSKSTGCKLKLLNDADAAGIAEVKFGRGRNSKGVVAVITLGTGIGTALFYHGILIPNMQLGHFVYKGKGAHHFASEKAKREKELSWKDWGKHVSSYLSILESHIWPELMIVGGGISEDFDKYKKYLNTRAKVVPAKNLNEAGIIGAALAAGKEFVR